MSFQVSPTLKNGVSAETVSKKITSGPLAVLSAVKEDSSQKQGARGRAVEAMEAKPASCLCLLRDLGQSLQYPHLHSGAVRGLLAGSLCYKWVNACVCLAQDRLHNLHTINQRQLLLLPLIAETCQATTESLVKMGIAQNKCYFKKPFLKEQLGIHILILGRNPRLKTLAKRLLCFVLELSLQTSLFFSMRQSMSAGFLRLPRLMQLTKPLWFHDCLIWAFNFPNIKV